MMCRFDVYWVEIYEKHQKTKYRFSKGSNLFKVYGKPITLTKKDILWNIFSKQLLSKIMKKKWP